MDQPYINNKNQLPPLWSIPQYPQAYSTQYLNSNFVNPNLKYRDQNAIPAQNYDDSSVYNLNRIPNHDQMRDAQLIQAKDKIKKCLLYLVILLIITGVVLSIVLPIKLVKGPLYYQLEPGYFFTESQNCTCNFTIRLNWVSRRYLNLAIQQPEEQYLVSRSNRNGTYGIHQEDHQANYEQYVAPCALTGQFTIYVAHPNSLASIFYEPQVVVKVNNVEDTMKKKLQWGQSNGQNYFSVAKFVISQHTTTGNWNFKLV